MGRKSQPPQRKIGENWGSGGWAETACKAKGNMQKGATEISPLLKTQADWWRNLMKSQQKAFIAWHNIRQLGPCVSGPPLPSSRYHNVKHPLETDSQIPPPLPCDAPTSLPHSSSWLGSVLPAHFPFRTEPDLPGSASCGGPGGCVGEQPGPCKTYPRAAFFMCHMGKPAEMWLCQTSTGSIGRR